MEFQSLTCEFCTRPFKTVSSLNNHQRTNKKCTQIQPETSKTVQKFECEHCSKNFTSKYRLTYHITNSCKIVKNFSALENKVKVLEEKIKILEEKPTTVNNNSSTITGNTITGNNNNIINISIKDYMTPELVRKTLKEHFNSETLKGGESVFADFTMDHFLNGTDKPIYICCDRSRKKFCYFDGKNQIEDPNADILTELVSFGLLEVLQKHYETSLKDLDEKLSENACSKDITKYFNDQKDNVMSNYFKLKKLKKDGEDYRNRLSKKLPKTMEEHETLLKVNQEISERKEKERQTLEHIKDELEPLPSLRMRLHRKTGMVFNSLGEVVGKYYLNPDGYDDYNDLTDSDKRICTMNNFRTVYYPTQMML